jgi:hypothetical protein
MSTNRRLKCVFISEDQMLSVLRGKAKLVLPDGVEIYRSNWSDLNVAWMLVLTHLSWPEISPIERIPELDTKIEYHSAEDFETKIWKAFKSDAVIEGSIYAYNSKIGMRAAIARFLKTALGIEFNG